MNELPKLIKHALEFTKVAKTNLIGEWLSNLPDDLLQELLSLTENFKTWSKTENMKLKHETHVVTDLTLFWLAREASSAEIKFELEELFKKIMMFCTCVKLERDIRDDLVFILDGQVNSYLSLTDCESVMLGCTSKGLLDPELSELALSMGKN